jgi:hypothetical protein
MKPDIKTRFLQKVAFAESGCWQWLGSMDRKGYARFGVNGRNTLAHRWIYEQETGAIPEGMVLDHLCRNRGCVNPLHLEPVTSRENTMRGETVAARNTNATHCPKGHPYTPENIYRRKDGGRQCKPCTLAWRKTRHLRSGK